MRQRLLTLVCPVLAALLLVGCSDAGTRTDATTAPTASAPRATFVCFKIAGDPGPDRFRAFAELVEQYPPAAGHVVSAGYKANAAVSVRLRPDEDASQWIADLPDTLRHDPIVRIVTAEDYDCGEVKA